MDVILGVQYLHEHGFLAGSISSKNILYHPSDVAWGKLHCPGIQEASDVPRNINFAKWPYYSEGADPLTEEDDLIAVTVVVIECMFADQNCRDSWWDLLKLEDKYDYKPENLIHDLLLQFK